jgi:hypothetical protein
MSAVQFVALAAGALGIAVLMLSSRVVALERRVRELEHQPDSANAGETGPR